MGPADFPVPPEARRRDAAGAEAFLRYWIDLVNRQRAIPAGQPLRDLSSECYDCLRIARLLDDASVKKDRYIGGEISLNDVTEPQFAGDTVSITFGARVEAASLVDASGEVIEARLEPSPNVGSGITLRWSEPQQGWIVTGYNVG